MKFDLKKPCSNCPFRSDDKGVRISETRAQEIADGITIKQGTFSCHKTTNDKDGDIADDKDVQHCAGAMIMLEKMEKPNQMMRLEERFGGYDRHKLDMNAPVVDDADEFVEHASRGGVFR